MSWLDFQNDWAGREILTHYLCGKGKSKTYSSSRWAKYMKNSKMCTCCGYKGNLTLEKYIEDYVRSIKSLFEALRVWQTKTVTHKISASLQNGEGIIGYNYLHGTNRTVGGLNLKMTAGKIANLITVKVECTWNDIMDPNFKYSSDKKKAELAKQLPFVDPTDFTVRIKWTQTVGIRYGVI